MWFEIFAFDAARTILNMDSRDAPIMVIRISEITAKPLFVGPYSPKYYIPYYCKKNKMIFKINQ